MLLEGEGPCHVAFQSSEFEAAWFELVPVPVTCNTGDGVIQGGGMILTEPVDCCPPYAAKVAPFWAFDCVRPRPDGVIHGDHGRVGLYVSIRPAAAIQPGSYRATLSAHVADREYTCDIELKVYDVTIPFGNFSMRNDYNEEAICRFHHCEYNSPEFDAIFRRYIRAMKETHQTHFYVSLGNQIDRKTYTYACEDIKSKIALFLEEGVEKIVLGELLTCGFLPNGDQDKRTDQFRLTVAPEVPVDSAEGIRLLSAQLSALAALINESFPETDFSIQIKDEPDEHCPSEAVLAKRQRQYALAAGLVRKFLPNVHIMDAIKTTTMASDIDVLVPITTGYQENKAAFDAQQKHGKTLWSYVCCVPGGKWLNRFLDLPLLRGRLLFWGFAANGITGYLMWGFNQWLPGSDPFADTRGLNTSGIGTDYPCGDAFISYPGEDGPWPSMRLYAQRHGAEDAALLTQLKKRSPKRAEALIAKVFSAFDRYNDDPQNFRRAYRELLLALEEEKEE